MVFAIRSCHERRVIITNIMIVSMKNENTLAPTKPVNSLPATEGFQHFDSKTQSLFVIKAKTTAATQAIKFASR